MTTMSHTHTKDCPDYKLAAADRKSYAVIAKAREERRQVLAHAVWFEWSAPTRTLR